MNVFDLRNTLIADYSEYISSFIRIHDPKIKECVDESIEQGLLSGQSWSRLLWSGAKSCWQHTNACARPRRRTM